VTAGVRPHRAIQILAAATLAAACQTETPSTNCQLAGHSDLPGSPLMLSPAARIDRVAQWFVLMGVDGNGAGGNGNVVRWATIELDGQAGPERSITVPAFTAGPWFAVAGDKTAGDTVLVAFGKPAGNGADLDLFVIAAPSDGSSPPAVPMLLTSIPGGATPGTPVNVVMTSSTTGMRGVMAWVVPAAPSTPPTPGMPPPRGPAAGAGAIKVLVVAGSGQPIGSVVR
jgi:hypothetical protein